MSIVSTHVNANLRMAGEENETVLSLHQIRPNLNAGNVESIMEGVELIRQQPVTGARLLITTELAPA